MSPPIQIPEMVSSTPRYLERPKPPATATVQTGQTALAVLKNERNKEINNKKVKRILFFMTFLMTYQIF